jgi:hypothetical protein
VGGYNSKVGSSCLGLPKYKHIGLIHAHKFVIPALRRVRQKDGEFKDGQST